MTDGQIGGPIPRAELLIFVFWSRRSSNSAWVQNLGQSLFSRLEGYKLKQFARILPRKICCQQKENTQMMNFPWSLWQICRTVLAAEEGLRSAVAEVPWIFAGGPRLQTGRSQLRVIDLAPTKHGSQTVDNGSNPVTCTGDRPDLTRIHKNNKEQ